MIINNIFCEFEDTNMSFNDKKVYACKNCGIKLTLTDPGIKILCFAKKKILEDAVNPYSDTTIDGIKNHSDIIKAAFDQLGHKSVPTEETFQQMKSQLDEPENPEDNLCSKEQIEERMSICQKCEYFKDNSCLLCGCTVIREKNYNNKLAKKNQHCPIFKWKAIKDN